MIWSQTFLNSVFSEMTLRLKFCCFLWILFSKNFLLIKLNPTQFFIVWQKINLSAACSPISLVLVISSILRNEFSKRPRSAASHSFSFGEDLFKAAFWFLSWLKFNSLLLSWKQFLILEAKCLSALQLGVMWSSVIKQEWLFSSN